VEVLNEHQDVGSGVGPSDADVVQAAAQARRVTQPVVSIRSVRTRSWVSALRSVPGVALGRAV
jgi:hypothetical protein